MATEPLPKIGHDDSFEKVRTAVGAGFDVIEYLLNGGLDSVNIRRLTANKIYTGTLDAGKVTIRSDLNGGAYVVIDGTGITVNDGSQNTFTVDIDGNVTIHDATFRINLSGDAYIQFDPSGMTVNNGTINTVEIDTNGNASFRGDIVAGADINVTSDVSIGDNLYMNASTVGDKAIIFNNSSGGTAGRIASQSGDMSFTAGGFVTFTIGSSQGMVVNEKITAPVINATTAVTVNNQPVAMESLAGRSLSYDSGSKILNLLNANGGVISSVTLT
jgi:hypothetical protein